MSFGKQAAESVLVTQSTWLYIAQKYDWHPSLCLPTPRGFRVSHCQLRTRDPKMAPLVSESQLLSFKALSVYGEFLEGS